MAKKIKHSSDVNQRAKAIVDIATGEIENIIITPEGKNANAVELGRLGGKVGGKATAAKLSKEQLSERARKAAKKRWGHK